MITFLAVLALAVLFALTSAVFAIAGALQRMLALLQEQNVHYGIGVGDLSGTDDDGVAPIGDRIAE